MKLNNLKAIVDVLETAGVGDGPCDAQHDILYLPWIDKTGTVAKELERLGCHWSSEGECWAIFT